MMLCPCCKSELIEDGIKPLETLCEHVCDPNGTPYDKMSYKCSNASCATHEAKIIWNDGGELYGDFRKIKGVKFIDNNDAPFGTFSRKMRVEIYKKDENKLLFTFPCWPLKNWKCRSDWKYESNENGDILSRKMEFEWVTDEGFVHVWGHHMMIYSIKEIYKNWKGLGKNPSQKNFYESRLKENITRLTWMKDPQWWRKISAFVSKIALKHRGIKLS